MLGHPVPLEIGSKRPRSQRCAVALIIGDNESGRRPTSSPPNAMNFTVDNGRVCVESTRAISKIAATPRDPEMSAMTWEVLIRSSAMSLSPAPGPATPPALRLTPSLVRMHAPRNPSRRQIHRANSIIPKQLYAVTMDGRVTGSQVARGQQPTLHRTSRKSIACTQSSR